MTKKTILIAFILFFTLFINNSYSTDIYDFNRKTNTFIQYVNNDDYLAVEHLHYDLKTGASMNATIDIYHYKSFNEVRVIYSILYRVYDQSEAVVQVRDALRRFIKEKGFLSYEYIRKDTTKLRKTDENEIFMDYTVYVKVNK